MRHATVMVDDAVSPRTWSHDELVGLPDVVRDARPATGRRGWAVPVAAILETDLGWVTVTSADGSYRASIPTASMTEGGWLLVGSDVAPLSGAEGGPFRLIVADGDTLCWNVKDVGSLVAGPESVPDSVPEDPPH